MGARLRKLAEANERLRRANAVIARIDNVANSQHPFQSKVNRRFKVP